MVLFNHSTRELTAKIVYYGAGLCGKTTNLTQLHDRLEKGTAGRLLSLATAQDRTIYFDLLPVELGNIKGYTVRFQLCTVPGQVYYNETRKLVLRGVDGIVFVVDSQWSMLSHNLESFQNLKENLADADVVFDAIPLIVQYNKRDLPGVLSVDALQESLGFQSYPYVEAIASAGKGVVETFKLVSKLTFVDLLRRLQRIPGPETTPTEPRGEVGEETVVQSGRRKPSSFVQPPAAASGPRTAPSAPPSGGVPVGAGPASAPTIAVPVIAAPRTPPPAPRAPASAPRPGLTPDDSWRRLFARIERASPPGQRPAVKTPEPELAPQETAPPAAPAAQTPSHSRLPTVAEPFELGSGVYRTPPEGEVFGDLEAPQATTMAVPPVTEPTLERAEDLNATRQLSVPAMPAVPDMVPESVPDAAPAAAPAPDVPAAQMTALRDELKAEVDRLSSELGALRSAIASDVTAARDGAAQSIASLREEVAGTLEAALQHRVLAELDQVRARLMEGRSDLERLRAMVGDGDAAVRQEHESARRQLLEAHGELAARIVPREELDSARREAERAAAALREEIGSLTTNVRHELALVREELRAETRRLEAAAISARDEAQALRAELDGRSRVAGEVVESSHAKLVEEIAQARQDARRELERLDAALADARRHADERVSRIAASFRRIVEELGPGD